MSGTQKQSGFIVTDEFRALLKQVEDQGFRQSYLVREGLAMLLRQRFGMEVPDDIVHPQLGGSRE
ncbi:MAG: hypothetical protein KC441_02465 [Anaerolineales bacterium]|nr:hypothetical protein [Anaerolineales bacterium]